MQEELHNNFLKEVNSYPLTYKAFSLLLNHKTAKKLAPHKGKGKSDDSQTNKLVLHLLNKKQSQLQALIEKCILMSTF